MKQKKCVAVRRRLREQEMGASALIVANTDDQLFRPGDPSGEGAGVTIPVWLIGAKDSTALQVSACLASVECSYANLTEGAFFRTGCVLKSADCAPISSPRIMKLSRSERKASQPVRLRDPLPSQESAIRDHLLSRESVMKLEAGGAHSSGGRGARRVCGGARRREDRGGAVSRGRGGEEEGRAREQN